VLVLSVNLAVAGARQRDVRNAVAGSASTRARLLPGLDIATHPGWARYVVINGGPLTFGNLEKAVRGATWFAFLHPCL
jgi:L-lactate dehydrogenase (cytochrome)